MGTGRGVNRSMISGLRVGVGGIAVEIPSIVITEVGN
jgi:hypothetical protein